MSYLAEYFVRKRRPNMAEYDILVHEVDYLATTNAKIGNEPVVVITIRPDLPSFRPHNLSIPRSSAERLLEDLKGLLNRSEQ